MSCKPYRHESTTGSDRKLVDDKSRCGAHRFTVLVPFKEGNSLQVQVGQGGISGYHHNELGILGALESH